MPSLPGFIVGNSSTATPADVSLASSAGWTARGGAGSGTASVNTGAERIDLSCVSGSGEVFASIGHAPWSLEPVVEICARLSSFSGGGTSAHYAAVYLANALAQGVYVSVELRDDDTARATSSAGNGAALPIVGLTAGEGWARIRTNGSGATLYAGVGSGGAKPTEWTCLGTVTISGAVAAWAYAIFQAGRASGSDVSAQWSSISYTVFP